MKGVSNLKGLADMRTAISTHYRSISRTKGSPYLEIMSLGMEKLRLNDTIEALGKREDRIQRRLVELRASLEKRLSEVQEDDPPDTGTSANAEKTPPSGGSWPTMKVEY